MTEWTSAAIQQRFSGESNQWREGVIYALHCVQKHGGDLDGCLCAEVKV